MMPSISRSLQTSTFRFISRCISTVGELRPRYVPSQLDWVEDVEEYRPNGFHPISIGDVFANGRYRVVHKLGFGASSTIWLARVQPSGLLVALKAMRADVSSLPANEIPKLVVPRALQAAFPGAHSEFQTVKDHFVVNGPNGSHQFLITPLAGPSVLSMSYCPGRVSGSRRLRADLARSVAKETALAMYRMHTAGWVHGDLTTSNILFRMAEHVLKWTDDEIYDFLGTPITEEVRTRDGQLQNSHAPQKLVEPIDIYKLVNPSLLQERIKVIDYGQSYVINSPPKGYQPATTLNYQSPEAYFEGHAGLEADVWALGCAIFEIRAGFPLFESFFGSKTDILKQTVETLGRLSDPWWGSFEERSLWFEDDGEPKSIEAQKNDGLLLQSVKSSIRDKLRSIGREKDPPDSDEGPMMEKFGMRLPVEEVELLGDLLEKMLKYRPEERIEVREVLGHPWFAFVDKP